MFNYNKTHNLDKIIHILEMSADFIKIEVEEEVDKISIIFMLDEIKS